MRLARRSASRRESAIRLALQEIADAQGDVDAFIAQQSEKAKTVPRVAAEIAQRLLEAGRADEAWSAINAVDEKRPFSFVAWTATKLAVSLVGHTWKYMGVMLVTGLVIAAGTYFMLEKPTTNFLKRLIKTLIGKCGSSPGVPVSSVRLVQPKVYLRLGKQTPSRHVHWRTGERNQTR